MLLMHRWTRLVGKISKLIEAVISSLPNCYLVPNELTKFPISSRISKRIRGICKMFITASINDRADVSGFEFGIYFVNVRLFGDELCMFLFG